MPIALTARLKVRDLGADSCRLHEVDHFANRLENPVALRSHVRRVESAAFRGDFCKRDDFFWRRVFSRLVDESGRETPAACVERLGKKTLHLL